MDALNFLKFWRNSTLTITPTSTSLPHLVVQTDSESDEEEDSFFDLELTLDGLQSKQTHKTQDQFKAHSPSKSQPVNDAPHSSEPISKRKVLPIEPASKPQSPIALLKSAPSFRIFAFKKRNRVQQHQKPEQKKLFSVKLNVHDCHSSPALSRDNSTRSFGSKLRSQGFDQPKTERFSTEALHKYLKLIKPLYVKASKRYTDKARFSGEGFVASPASSPSVASVSSRKEKQGSFPAGMKGVSKHFGKSRSASTVTGIGSPANWSDDTLLQQHDGIQSAILHCKRSFNSRDSVSSEGSMYSLRNSFEGECGAKG